MWNHVKALRVLLPRQLSWRKAVLAAAGVGLLAGAFCFGRWGALSQATAQPPQEPPYRGDLPIQLASNSQPKAGDKVAYIYGTIPVTRAELGDYLIARLGAERLDFMVNRKIIELECQRRGITVTDAEIEAELIKHLRSMNIPSLEGFVTNILKRNKKTLYEYREDVLRPQIAMRKMCHGSFTITEQELKDAFEAKYGKKVLCRLIVFLKDDPFNLKTEIWEKVSKSEEEFNKCARDPKIQKIPALAAQGGVVPPIHKHFPDPNIEKIAFSLRPGEVSQLIDMPDKTTVILRCEQHLDPVTHVQFADEVNTLREEVYERKMAAAIPKLFNQLKEQAAPKLFLTEERIDPQLARTVNRALLEASRERERLQKAMQDANQKLPPLPPTR